MSTALPAAAIVVTMIGGPFDGQLLAVPGTDLGAPREPTLFTTQCLSNHTTAHSDDDGVNENIHLGIRRGRYELHITNGEQGPLWQYRYAGTLAY